MTLSLRLDFDEPLHGWLGVRLTVEGASVFDEAVSRIPHDFVAELIAALSLMSLPGAEATACAGINPRRVEWRFSRDHAGSLGLRLVSFRDGSRVESQVDLLADIVGPVDAIRRPLWRGLRRLAGVEGYEQGWREPFPRAALERLTAEIRGG